MASSPASNPAQPSGENDPSVLSDPDYSNHPDWEIMKDIIINFSMDRKIQRYLWQCEQLSDQLQLQLDNVRRANLEDGMKAHTLESMESARGKVEEIFKQLIERLKEAGRADPNGSMETNN
ncbi:MAG: hypothetical protein Q9174_007240 [Haloplaca sp. 1 TL-2023]